MPKGIDTEDRARFSTVRVMRIGLDGTDGWLVNLCRKVHNQNDASRVVCWNEYRSNLQRISRGRDSRIRRLSIRLESLCCWRSSPSQRDEQGGGKPRHALDSDSTITALITYPSFKHGYNSNASSKTCLGSG